MCKTCSRLNSSMSSDGSEDKSFPERYSSESCGQLLRVRCGMSFSSLYERFRTRSSLSKISSSKTSSSSWLSARYRLRKEPAKVLSSLADMPESFLAVDDGGVM